MTPSRQCSIPLLQTPLLSTTTASCDHGATEGLHAKVCQGQNLNAEVAAVVVPRPAVQPVEKIGHELEFLAEDNE